MRACMSIFGAFFLDLWLENQSLEPLINMLAHRETKLWLKNPVFAKLWHFQKRWHWPLLFNFGHSWLAARLSYSKLLKTREVFYIRLTKTFRNFFGLFGPWPHDWRMFCEYSYDYIRGSNTRILLLRVLLDPGVEYEFFSPWSTF